MKVEEDLRRPNPPRTPLLVALAVVAAVAVLSRVELGDLLPTWPNPFATEERDRSQPALLEAIEDLSQYRAATGNFQVILDVEEDAPFLPDFVRGERTLFLAAGTVDAYVDFSRLDDEAIEVSADGTAVRVTLPAAQLAAPRVDPEESYVVSRDRGLLDRVGGLFSDSPTGERELYLRAQERLTAAAQRSGLTDRAEGNTRAMLEGMLRSLGYRDITIDVERPPT